MLVSRLGLVARGERRQVEQVRARRNLRSRSDVDRLDHAVHRRVEVDLHLHHFDRHQALTARDLLACLDGDRGHDRGHISLDLTIWHALEAVRDVVRVDLNPAPTASTQRRETALTRHECDRLIIDVLDLDHGRPVLSLNLEELWRQLANLDRDGVTVDEVAIGRGLRFGEALWRTCVHTGEEILALLATLGVEIEQGGGDERLREQRTTNARRTTLEEPIEPTRGVAVFDEVIVGQHLEHHRAVGQATLDDDARIAQRLLQPRDRFLTVATVGDDLGDVGVECASDHIACAEARVDADARAARDIEDLDLAASGREAHVGLLGVEARLDGCAARLWRVLRGELCAERDLDLCVHEIEPEDALGDGVLDLEASVHLEEVEGLHVGEEQELCGSCANVTASLGHAARGLADALINLWLETRGGRLLDDFLVTALHRAIARPERPDRPVRIRQDLNLDVTRALDVLLHEQRAIAEGADRLGGRRMECVGELVVAAHQSDAATTTTGGGLEDEREADLLGHHSRLLGVLDRATRPGAHGDLVFLRERLGADLIAEQAHDAAGRSDELDACVFACIREVGAFAKETPARPHSVDAELGAFAHEPFDVEVARDAGARGIDHEGIAECDGRIGHLDKRRARIRICIKGDEFDRLRIAPAPNARRAHKTHSGLAAVDDRDAHRLDAIARNPSGRRVIQSLAPYRSCSPLTGGVFVI